MKRWFARALLLVMILMTIYPTVPSIAENEIISRMYLYKDRTDVFVNQQSVTWPVAPRIINGALYVPITNFVRSLGGTAEYDATLKSVIVKLADKKLGFNQKMNVVFTPKTILKYEPDVKKINDQLWVKLNSIAKWLGFTSRYDAFWKRYEVEWNPTMDALLYDPNVQPGKPVARFATNHDQYRIGERVVYNDLSLDPDGIGIVKWKWSGKQEAFFKPGTYTISLTVVDASGLLSDPFEKTITVSNDVFLADAFLYDAMYKPAGTVNMMDRISQQRFRLLPAAEKAVSSDPTDFLFVSNSPEKIMEPGILYRDQVQGNVRVYASHLNGGGQPMNVVLVAKNIGEENANVTIKKQVGKTPTPFAHLLGYTALLDDFIAPTSEAPPEVMINPGQSVILITWPTLQPGMGLNMLADLQVDHALVFSVMAMPSLNSDMFRMDDWTQLASDKHLRGTFNGANVKWTITPPEGHTAFRLTLGDGLYDVSLNGIDRTKAAGVTNKGNYGVNYTISWKNHGKYAILVQPRGGAFKGLFKLNENYVAVPGSGVITPYDGLVLLGRVRSTDQEVTIRYSPPAGSAFPVDLIIVPLPEES